MKHETSVTEWTPEDSTLEPSARDWTLRWAFQRWMQFSKAALTLPSGHRGTTDAPGSLVAPVSHLDPSRNDGHPGNPALVAHEQTAAHRSGEHSPREVDLGWFWEVNAPKTTPASIHKYPQVPDTPCMSYVSLFIYIGVV